MNKQNVFRKFENWLERWFDTISLVMFLVAVGWGTSLRNSLFDSILLG